MINIKVGFKIWYVYILNILFLNIYDRTIYDRTSIQPFVVVVVCERTRHRREVNPVRSDRGYCIIPTKYQLDIILFLSLISPVRVSMQQLPHDKKTAREFVCDGTTTGVDMSRVGKNERGGDMSVHRGTCPLVIWWHIDVHRINKMLGDFNYPIKLTSVPINPNFIGVITLYRSKSHIVGS